jgi:hypothetical protein
MRWVVREGLHRRRSLHISFLELSIWIEVVSPLRVVCFAWTDVGFARPLQRGSLPWSLFSGVGVAARGGVVTITPVLNFDELSLLRCVQLVLVAKLARCAVNVVLFHDDRRVCLYLFLG